MLIVIATNKVLYTSFVLRPVIINALVKFVLIRSFVYVTVTMTYFEEEIAI